MGRSLQLAVVCQVICNIIKCICVFPFWLHGLIAQVGACPLFHTSPPKEASPSGWCTPPSAVIRILTSSPTLPQKVSKCLHAASEFPAKLHTSTQRVHFSLDPKDILAPHSFLPLIKSKTEQRNHHWHLVNVTLYHSYLFTTHKQPWLESNKRKKKSPSQSESMLHRNVSELCLMMEPWSYAAAAIYVNFVLSSHSNNCALLPPLSYFKQYRKDQKKVDKLTAQIPYHEGRGNKEEVEKIKAQVDAIWAKTREAAFA